jgi:hypothetical protein
LVQVVQEIQRELQTVLVLLVQTLFFQLSQVLAAVQAATTTILAGKTEQQAVQVVVLPTKTQQEQ